MEDRWAAGPVLDMEVKGLKDHVHAAKIIFSSDVSYIIVCACLMRWCTRCTDDTWLFWFMVIVNVALYEPQNEDCWCKFTNAYKTILY